MCLTIRPDQKALCAEQDIKVYKVVLPDVSVPDQYYTLYRTFPIRIGETYTSELIVIDRWLRENNIIEVGLHSYTQLEDAMLDARWEDVNFAIVECIIPKGAKYYQGEFGHDASYASDQLKYDKVLFTAKVVREFCTRSISWHTADGILINTEGHECERGHDISKVLELAEITV